MWDFKIAFHCVMTYILMSWYCPHMQYNFVLPHETQSHEKIAYDILYSEPTYNPLPFSFFSFLRQCRTPRFLLLLFLHNPPPYRCTWGCMWGPHFLGGAVLWYHSGTTHILMSWYFPLWKHKSHDFVLFHVTQPHGKKSQDILNSGPTYKAFPFSFPKQCGSPRFPLPLVIHSPPILWAHVFSRVGHTLFEWVKALIPLCNDLYPHVMIFGHTDLMVLFFLT